MRQPSLSVVGQEWLASIPDIHARLSDGSLVRVADLGCGAGWLPIGVARAYPGIRVVGIDADARSIDAARQHAREAGLDERIDFELGDAAGLAVRERFDLVVIFEVRHDLNRPVDVPGAARGLLAPGGIVVVDERTADRFQGLAVDDPIERFLYAVSTTVCLPNGLAEQPSSAAATVPGGHRQRGACCAAASAVVGSAAGTRGCFEPSRA